MSTTPVTIQELIDGATDLETIEAIANSSELTYASRTGGTVKTMAGVRAATKYAVPVTFTSSISVTAGTQTVSHNGVIYAPVPSELPFTTTGTFNSSQWYPIQDPRGYVHVDTKAELAALTTSAFSAGDIVRVKNRATTGDGGGGIFRWSSSDLSTEVAADTQEGIYVPPDSDTDGSSGAWVRDYPGAYVNPLWWGATPDGSTDSSTAIQECLDAGPCIITEAYAVTTITTSYYLSMTGVGKFVYNGAQNGTCLTLGADFGDIYVDGGLEDCIGVTIDTNGVKGRSIYVEKITASATSSTSIYPIRINANNVQIETARTYNTQNTGQSNGSFPQAVGIVGTSDNTRVNEVYCELGACALAIGSSTGNTFIRHARSKTMTDNGVYGLGGYVFMDEFIYEGTEEAYVAYSGEHNVGRITTIGACTGALELQSGNNVSVGEIFMTDDGTGYTASKAVLARSSATDVGRIYIGSIKGHMKNATGIINVSDASSVEYLQIDNIDVLLEYDSTNMPTLNAWFDLTNVEQYRIGPATIRIRDVDDTIVSTTNFVSAFPDPVRDSLIENFDVTFEDSNGDLNTYATYRGTAPTDTLLVKGAVWLGSGTYAREATYLGGMRDATTAAPSNGYWRAGTVLWHIDGSAAAFAFRCSVSGSPGTWETLVGS